MRLRCFACPCASVTPTPRPADEPQEEGGAQDATEEAPQAAVEIRKAPELLSSAEAESTHAFADFRANGVVGTTAENLQAAINCETFEFSVMYPHMIKDDEAEGDKTAARVFHFANEAEKVHAQLYKEALADMAGAEDDYYLCPICGYIHKGKTEANCPICGAKASIFKKF